MLKPESSIRRIPRKGSAHHNLLNPLTPPGTRSPGAQRPAALGPADNGTPTADAGPHLSPFPRGSLRVAGMMAGQQLLWRLVVPIIAAIASGGLSSDQLGWEGRRGMERPSPSCEPNAPNATKEPGTQSRATETKAGPTAYLGALTWEWPGSSSFPEGWRHLLQEVLL